MRDSQLSELFTDPPPRPKLHSVYWTITRPGYLLRTPSDCLRFDWLELDDQIVGCQLGLGPFDINIYYLA